jgi:hypothetical protein
MVDAGYPVPKSGPGGLPALPLPAIFLEIDGGILIPSHFINLIKCLALCVKCVKCVNLYEWIAVYATKAVLLTGQREAMNGDAIHVRCRRTGSVLQS